jgi:hypothetical protein
MHLQHLATKATENKLKIHKKSTIAELRNLQSF